MGFMGFLYLISSNTITDGTSFHPRCLYGITAQLFPFLSLFVIKLFSGLNSSNGDGMGTSNTASVAINADSTLGTYTARVLKAADSLFFCHSIVLKANADTLKLCHKSSPFFLIQ